jgi:hypothetical protein
VWAEYQKHHDVSAHIAETAGIDPVSGRIWFGESATDIRRQMDAEGLETPLLCLRVGSDYYVRKGGRLPWRRRVLRPDDDGDGKQCQRRLAGKAAW